MEGEAGPVDFIIRFEGLESSLNQPIELPYNIDSKFEILNLLHVARLHFEAVQLPNMFKILSELSVLLLNSELQILEGENKDIMVKRLENETFIPDHDDFEIVWDFDKYVVMNQGLKVIELFPDKKYLMIIRKRSKKTLILIILNFIIKSKSFYRIRVSKKGFIEITWSKI
jgi:hypothetical protein